MSANAQTDPVQTGVQHDDAGPAIVRRVDWDVVPDELIARWPDDWKLAALVSGAEPDDGAPSRWTILGVPHEERLIVAATCAGAAARGERDPLADCAPGRHVPEVIDAAHGAGDEVGASVASSDLPPFVGGWIGVLSYDLGRELEPSASGLHARSKAHGDARPDSPLDDAWPLVVTQSLPAALAYDHALRRWYAVGRRHLADRLAREVEDRVLGASSRAKELDDSAADYALGPLRALIDESRWGRDVSGALAAIGRGDVYQVNLAYPSDASFSGSSRALARRWFARASPRFGAYLELDDRAPATGTGANAGPPVRRALVSASPELFLRVDLASGAIETRPMKGTRALPALAHAPAGEIQARAELELSEKERAELSMIVDLMRNDLGRVCQPGSVRVSERRTIETHGLPGAGGVLQATANVVGRLRPGLTLRDVVSATFPPGSVTGAPKISAMRLIERTEAAPRAWYCGSVFCTSFCGRSTLSVAIRSAMIQGADGSRADDSLVVGSPGDGAGVSTPRWGRFAPGSSLRAWFGAGIVSDSEAGGEWRETLEKSAGLRSLVNTPVNAPVNATLQTPKEQPQHD